MWRRPLAYGHATATRIFLGESDVLTAVNHMEALSCPPGRDEARSGDHCEHGEHPERKPSVVTANDLRSKRALEPPKDISAVW
jgi:hypothetical protein